MRKILYSPGYGAGWTSWNNHEVAKIMISYQPIIDALEKGESLLIGSAYSLNLKDEQKYHPAVLQLIKECEGKFNGRHVCVLGAGELKIKVVEDGQRVRIHEYDGYESVELEGDYEGWL